MQDLQAAVRRMLIHFYAATNKKKPERILYFRDGLSEGQFEKIRAIELPAIVACCRELGRSSGEEYAPPVSHMKF